VVRVNKENLMSDFKNMVAEKMESLRQARADASKVIYQAKKVDLARVFEDLKSCEPGARIWMGCNTIYIQLPVKSMKHMLEALDFVQTRTGVEFDQSFDSPSAGQRTFHSTRDGWLCITAEVAQNDQDAEALCKRVQTGIEMVERPIFELKCLDAA
jgi:hypothetical protein